MELAREEMQKIKTSLLKEDIELDEVLASIDMSSSKSHIYASTATQIKRRRQRLNLISQSESSEPASFIKKFNQRLPLAQDMDMACYIPSGANSFSTSLSK